MRFLLSITYVAVLGILAHYVGESMPRRWFFPESYPYAPQLWEKNGKIYDKIKIKKWKNKVPDMSRVMKDMLPKRVSHNPTSEALNELIKETCVAEFIHHFLSLFSIGIYFIWKNETGFILVLVFIACNTPFVFIQRYNRPHLISLRNRLIAREEHKKHEITDSVL